MPFLQRLTRSNAIAAVGSDSARRSRLSHLHLFAIGWVYYLLIPILAGRLGLFESSDSFSLMRRFASPQDRWWPALMLYAVLLPLAFLVGNALAGRIPNLRGLRTPIAGPSQILVPVYALALLLTGYAARGNFFAGYSADLDIAAVGPISTLQMCLVFQYLAARVEGSRSTRWLGILLLLSSVLLLGMGGRLYVLSALVAIYVDWWKFRASGPRARLRSLVAVIVTPLAFGVVGMLRLGVFDLADLSFYIFAEPLFTSISAFTLMDGNGWALLDTPRDFFSAFINLIPAAVWPGKTDYVISLLDTSLNFEAPFGAVSIVTSTIGNFGYLGGPLFLGFVGFVMGRTRRGTGTAAGRALYCYLCSLLPFMLFRDPFPVQIKVALLGFVLIWVNRVVGVVLETLPRVSRS